jgi:hypothetical protein
MGSVGADVRAPVPAPFAPGLPLAHWTVSTSPNATVAARRDRDEAQVVAQRSQRFVIGGGAVIATSACNDDPIAPD